MARILIITPTYDERENLARFLELVHAEVPDADVLVVDDASPDGTGQVADAIAARDHRVSVLHRAGKLGLGTAYLAGFKHALANGYDYVFEMDTDLSHDPVHLPAFLRALDDGADLVLGSRWVAGGGVEGWGIGRTVLSRGGSLYSRMILGGGIRDFTGGFKGFRRRLLEALPLGDVKSTGYSFQIEMTYRAVRRGFRVVEVPIKFVDRRAGQSKMSRKIFAEAVAMVWRLRWMALRKKL